MRNGFTSLSAAAKSASKLKATNVLKSGSASSRRPLRPISS